MKKLLVYELNEVPWRVVDSYLLARPRSNLSRIAGQASLYTTKSQDVGELHPWSTWPTMHRGVNNERHRINYINQDLSCAKEFPPIWEILADNDRTVGLCGCLQSYPPIHTSNVLFHIPDTFAAGSETVPSRYQGFQRLNLRLTGENKAEAQPVGMGDLMSGLGLLSSGIQLRTVSELVVHLVREQTDSHFKSLRPTMQAHVAFDVFFDGLKRHRPAYAAFFSNHVAGAMHRYWKYLFPEDFGYSLSDSPFDQFHRQSILGAMDIFDYQLGILDEFSRKHGYDLVVASSMGQEAVDRGEYIPELKLDDEKDLARGLGFPYPLKMNLAMQPDVVFEFADSHGLKAFQEIINDLKDADGLPVLVQRYEEQGLTLNLTVKRSKVVAESCRLQYGGEWFDASHFGFRLLHRDQGTGYHQPDGILLWRGSEPPSVTDRRIVDSRQFAPTVLQAMSVPRPGYMMAPVF